MTLPSLGAGARAARAGEAEHPVRHRGDVWPRQAAGWASTVQFVLVTEGEEFYYYHFSC